MNDTIRLTLILLAIAFIGWPLLFLAITALSGMGLESKSDWPSKPTYTGGIEKIGASAARVTVNDRTFEVVQQSGEIFVTETTGGRRSEFTRISDSCHRFGQSKQQAAVNYIKTVVDEGHPLPRR